jgi:hypothetical protein
VSKHCRSWGMNCQNCNRGCMDDRGPNPPRVQHPVQMDERPLGICVVCGGSFLPCPCHKACSCKSADQLDKEELELLRAYWYQMHHSGFRWTDAHADYVRWLEENKR